MAESEIESEVTETTATSPKYLPLSTSFQRRTIASWIMEHFQKMECIYYVTGAREGICCCGYPKSEHADKAFKPEDFVGELWDKRRHVTKESTDAFGDISFEGLGQKTGKYVRVSTDTDPKDLYGLLTNEWNLSPPNLLISVTGGAKNFYMRENLKGMFHRGLIRVAKTTGAWIITGGTNTGVMKHVGQAVRDYTLSGSTDQRNIVAIGIATWGTLHNSKALVNPGCYPANYSMDIQGQGRLSCLDNNHSHFILVDDGTHGFYGVEIQLRSQLEGYISRQSLGNKDSNVTIPVVCVVLDGGPGTLNTMFNAMLNGTPCVVLEGSGRIADVIAQVAGLPVTTVTLALIHQLMKKFFGAEYNTFTELNITEWTKKIQDIIRMPHLLTIFGINEDKHRGVDVAILQALLKASRSNGPLGKESWQTQLELAVAWNRADIAETEIFTEESQWKSSDLQQAMFSALVGHKPQFVRLLLENGVSLKNFLHDGTTLCNLYKQLPSCFFLRKLARRAKEHGICMTHVSDEVRHLLGSFTQHLYPSTATRYHVNVSLEDTTVAPPARDQQHLEGTGDGPSDPERDLFLWAILHNQKELAEIPWEQCRDCTSAALAACKIIKTIAKEGRDLDEAGNIIELANHYERHAAGVFRECYSCSEERAQKLLVRVSPSWGGTTCLRLALEADAKSFVALPGVQALLTQIWCGELAVDNPVWRVMMSMIFFPLIYTGFLAYRHDKVIHRESERNKEIITMETVTGSSLRRETVIHTETLELLSAWSKLHGLYSSPQVKFYWNIVSYFAFLFVFAVVLMIDFQATPSWLEMLLYVWLVSLVGEELRQLFHDPDGFGHRRNARTYISDLWNILDVLSIGLFIIGLSFRLTTQLFYAGKVVLCIDFIVFCLRLMAIFTISRILGPKIIIVRKMMTDMFFFMFLLSIWVIAYGVAKQGILIHNESRLDWIVRGAVYEPYLIIFGNVPTNIDNAAFSRDSCTLNGSEALKPKCPVLNENNLPVFPEWLTIILLCVYLLFANILLLNLLIAIFNFTFQEIQDNTDRIWKFQRFELIKEYHSRPTAPPPFIILSHLLMFVKHVMSCRPPTKYKEFKSELPAAEDNDLLSWEALMKDNYLLSSRQNQSQSMEGLIQDTAEKVTIIKEQLEREDEGGSAAIVKRLARLEEQVSQSAEALQWVMEMLRSQPQDTSQLPKNESLKMCGKASDKEKEAFHVNARLLHYTDKVIRFPVPEEKVPWEVSFPLYMPVVYSSDNSGDKIDGKETDALDNYRNPGGRTGIRGRGVLTHLGPNRIVELVLTRWRDSGRSTLEFLAVRDKSQTSWALPGGPVRSDEILPVTFKGMMGKNLYEKIQAKVVDGITVFEGYVDDCRNTDNAWVETTVLNIHLDRTGLVMVDTNHMVASSHDSVNMVQWQKVSSDTRLCLNQKDALRRVAKLHNRKF